MSAALQEAAGRVRAMLATIDANERAAFNGDDDAYDRYRDARARLISASGDLLDALRAEGLA